MPVFNIVPKFLYPHSRQFPFDEVAEKIVRELQKRNFSVPGITVDFDFYGSGEAKYQHVYHVIGNDFKLSFMRVQRSLGNGWNDVAALYEICIPKQILAVYNDESGPTYYLYVGEDWEKDKNWFMNSIKVNAKYRHETRKYLKYKGAHSSNLRRAELLVADNNLNREYTPQGEEPKIISYSQKLAEFTSWLKENVLYYILQFPEANVIKFPNTQEELISYQGPWNIVYSICNHTVAKRIEEGKKDATLMSPERRYALAPSRRLVDLSVACHERFPKIAYEGFIWCDASQEKDAIKRGKLLYTVWNAMSSCGDLKLYLLAIKLKYANHVYVVDNFPYEETRQQYFRHSTYRDRLTDEEIGNAYAARGATIVPITDYKGGYQEPMVLIHRELDFDEVEIITEIKNR